MTVDGLTQIFNRRYFNEALEREFNRSQALRARAVAHRLRHRSLQARSTTRTATWRATASCASSRTAVKPRLRREDIFARTGGEEFGDPPAGDRARRRAHHGGEGPPHRRGHAARGTSRTTIPCTVSLGVAMLDAADAHARGALQARRRAPVRGEAGRPQPRGGVSRTASGERIRLAGRPAGVRALCFDNGRFRQAAAHLGLRAVPRRSGAHDRGDHPRSAGHAAAARNVSRAGLDRPGRRAAWSVQ